MSVLRDVTRLPKWAQARIEMLERNNEYLKAVLAEGPEDSDTFANPYSDSPRPLGAGASIRFEVDRELRRRFDVRLEDGVLEVYADSTISIRPYSSNNVRISIADR